MAQQGSGGKGPPPRRPGDFSSEFEDSVSGATTRSGVSRSGSAPVKNAFKPPPRSPRNPVAAPPIVPAAQHQKKLQRSAFEDDDERTEMDSLLGGSGATLLPFDEDDDEPTAVEEAYDGVTPAKELTSRDVWKAVSAPVQSREGRRSSALYQQVIHQFAVGHNPRYQPDGSKPRGHIFVWDVTRAMNVEVPHFAGPREMTLSQTCDWLRTEGPMRGWFRTDLESALRAAAKGQPVLVMPKDVRVSLLGVLNPGATGAAEVRVAAAAVKIGGQLTLQEAFGQFVVEYFFHV